MGELIKQLAALTNDFHDALITLCKNLGFTLTDKALHFIIIGLIGMTIFFITDFLFKKLSKWNISCISFIYTFTVLIVIVFAIEIEQKITHRGNMEFEDIIAGIWGFIILFLIYATIRLVIYIAKGATSNRK